MRSAAPKAARTTSRGGTVIQVKVRPNAGTSLLERAPDGSWLARLKSPPVDGKANAELVALVARAFGCHKADVTIRSGAAARLKRVHIEGGTPPPPSAT